MAIWGRLRWPSQPFQTSDITWAQTSNPVSYGRQSKILKFHILKFTISHTHFMVAHSHELSKPAWSYTSRELFEATRLYTSHEMLAPVWSYTSLEMQVLHSLTQAANTSLYTGKFNTYLASEQDEHFMCSI